MQNLSPLAPLHHEASKSHEWTRFLDAHIQEVAASVMALLLHPDLWISRRTEEVDFVDDRTVSRRVSVSFEVPAIAHGFEIRPGRSVLFAPLALLGKGLARRLTVTTGAGERIPMVNRVDSQEIAATMLIELATSVLGEPPNADLKDELEAVATGAPDASLKRAQILEERARRPGEDELEALWREHRVPLLIEDVARKFIFIVPCFDLADYDEAIVMYTYEETLESAKTDLAVRLGWRPIPVEVKVPSVGLARSCDIDIRVPDDLCMSTAAISDHRTHARLADDPEAARTAHLYVAQAEREARGVAGLKIYTQAGAFSWATFGAAALATLILGAGAIWAGNFAKSAEPASAILLGLPALLAGYLTRPGEHGLVQRAVWGLRFALGVTFFVSILAIVALVAGLGTEGRALWFGISAGLTALAAGAVAVSLLSGWRSASKSAEIRKAEEVVSAETAVAAVRFPEMLKQQGLRPKGFWTGSPEGYLAEAHGQIDVDRTVELLFDIRSRLPSGAADPK
jgi:hypothetical protein